MLNEIITKERLKKFYDSSVCLKRLEKEVVAFENNFNALKANNFTDVRVTSGSKKQSVEEMYVACLESKNKKLNELRNYVNSEYLIIKAQIDRVQNIDYKNILTDRYLKLTDWKLITLEYFGNEKDFWVQREFKYHFVVMTWHSRAVEYIEKISRQPFVPEENEKQLTLGEV